MNAPFTWPNSSDSNRVSLVAPRSTETIGCPLRRDRRWISRATISLPVPFSPRIRTLASVGAARSISMRTRSIAGDCAEQRRFGRSARARTRGPRSVRASIRLRRSAAALRTVAASRSLLHGLATKSLAPALIASTAIETAPWAVMITTAASGSMLHDLAEEVEALAPVGRAALEIEVEQDRVRTFLLEQRQQLGGRAQASRRARTGRAAQAAPRARCRDRRRRRRQG